jgi:predicted amidohydrolase
VLQVRVIQVAYGDDEAVEQRVARVAQLVRQQQGADLIVLPELWSHGGFAHSTWRERAEPLTGPTVAALSAAVQETGAVAHIGSLVERVAAATFGPPLASDGRGLWNTSVVLGPDGQIRTTYRKVHRFGFGEGEPVLLEAGEEIVTSELTDRRGGVATLGLATCYDLRFPELFRALLDAGSEVFVVPAAWPLARVEHWQLLGRARALENQCFVIQCNTAGTHSGVAMGGNSQVVGPDGTVLARAGAGEEVLSVTVDLAELENFRRSFPVLRDRRLLPAPGG